MKLSQNLLLKEVTKSDTAEQRGIDNTQMTDGVLKNLQELAKNVFQPAREELGRILVTSGYRSPELNKAIGGASSSMHQTGEALDLKALDTSNKELFYFIKENLVFDQLIWEYGNKKNPDWVHVSYKREGDNRYQVLKAVRKTVYLNWDES